MSETPQTRIDYFKRGRWLVGIQDRLSLAARRRMFGHWQLFAQPIAGKSMLDVGATPQQERPDSNCMIPWFRDAGMRVTLYSPEDISGLAGSFPWATILPSAAFGAPIPVPDRSYDWVASSAVIEHVGAAAEQIAFLRECGRVADGLFITTPNRYHWLEFHTRLPLLHWLPRRLHRLLLRSIGRGEWAQECNLRLLGTSELRALAAAALGDHFTVEIRRIWTLGMPSNLVVLARRAA